MSWPLPLGIDGASGAPLAGFDDAAGARIFDAETGAATDTLAAERARADLPHAGTVGDVEPNDLAQAGWGIVFPRAWPQARVAAVKEALGPLLALRESEAGELYRVFEGEDGYTPGEDARAWLARHDCDLGPVDPGYGVPFYLLLAGGPADIPFEFQYQLDVFWAVGRLGFESPKEFAAYAAHVVAAEGAAAKAREPTFALFAPAHPGDAATNLFNEQVATPLVEGETRRTAVPPLGARRGWRLAPIVGDAASQSTFEGLLGGTAGRPAVVFTGSHGAWFAPTDRRYPKLNGALVCRDWPGKGALAESHLAGASIVSARADVQGAIFMLFACYGAGWPGADDFAAGRTLAPAPALAALPAALLVGGAGAVIGHVDRAWATSFQNAQGASQTQRLRDVLERLARGDRVGLATDQFNAQWAAFGTLLADRLRDRDHGLTVPDAELAHLWVSRNDARNYVVLGDPAVRVRVGG